MRGQTGNIWGVVGGPNAVCLGVAHTPTQELGLGLGHILNAHQGKGDTMAT